MQGLRFGDFSQATKVPECWKGGQFQYDYKFAHRMNEKAKEMGLLPKEWGKESPGHLASYSRLKAIWKLSQSQVCGYSSWRTNQDKDVLACRPAQELIMVRPGAEVEPWRERWQNAMCDLIKRSTAIITMDGRMIARKHDPIWAHLNCFGVPWAPFDYSGEVYLRNIRRREARALGYDDEDIPKEWMRSYDFDWSFEGFLEMFLHDYLVAPEH